MATRLKIHKTNSLTKAQIIQIRELWNKEYPIVINQESIESLESYLSNLSDQHHIILENDEKEIKGWFFDFFRDKERWYAMIIDSDIQGKGYGVKLMELGKASNETLNGWVITSNDLEKINGEKYKSPIGFYEKTGFQILYDIKSESKLITAIKINWKQ
ncbi:MAG: GNAT family N-acetyltransferase [Bacteroidota bacterium]